MIENTQIDLLKEVFVKRGVVLAYLFGSQAEGRITPLSDIDIAVLLPHNLAAYDKFRAQADLIGDCGQVLKRNDVDVVVLNDTSPLLAFRVVKRGRLLYEDPVTHPAVAFAAQTLSRYADMAPFRNTQQRYLVERIRRHKAMEQAVI